MEAALDSVHTNGEPLAVVTTLQKCCVTVVNLSRFVCLFVCLSACVVTKKNIAPIELIVLRKKEYTRRSVLVQDYPSLDSRI